MTTNNKTMILFWWLFLPLKNQIEILRVISFYKYLSKILFILTILTQFFIEKNLLTQENQVNIEKAASIIWCHASYITVQKTIMVSRYIRVFAFEISISFVLVSFPIYIFLLTLSNMFPSSWKEKEKGWRRGRGKGEEMGRKMGRGDDMININGETVSVNRIMYT